MKHNVKPYLSNIFSDLGPALFIYKAERMMMIRTHVNKICECILLLVKRNITPRLMVFISSVHLFIPKSWINNMSRMCVLH